MTISYGSMLAVKVIGINLDYTMSISLLVLKPLAADSNFHQGRLFGNK